VIRLSGKGYLAGYGTGVVAGELVNVDAAACFLPGSVGAIPGDFFRA